MVQAIWWPTFKKFNWWDKFEENYFMSLTMCLGSFIAGATSEGGGAIAYPVMTLGPVQQMFNSYGIVKNSHKENWLKDHGKLHHLLQEIFH